MHQRLAEVFSTILGCCYVIYLWSPLGMQICDLRGWDKKFWNTLWTWTKWPALGFCIAYLIANVLLNHHQHWWDTALTLSNFFFWWNNKDKGDDDFTRKLKKACKEKVAEIGGKLVVVPEAA